MPAYAPNTATAIEHLRLTISEEARAGDAGPPAPRARSSLTKLLNESNKSGGTR
jgi:hypothetical protein